MRAASLWKRITASVNGVTVRAFSGEKRGGGRRSRFAMQRHLNTVIRKLETVSKQHPHISHAALLEICSEICGEQKSERLAQMCYRSGHVLRFERRVYTSPGCPGAVLSQISLDRQRLRFVFDRVRSEFARSHLRKRELDYIAYVGTKRAFLVGLTAFVFQWLLFIRLTFVEFSWDVMEPVAYFTTMFLGLASYGYYLITYKRPKYDQVSRRLLETRRVMLYERDGFDLERYRVLKQRVAVYRGYLEETKRDASLDASSSD